MDTTASPNLSRITITPGQRSGQPCIRGLRITVRDVLDMLAAGMTEAEILQITHILRRPTPDVYAYVTERRSR